MALGHVAIMQAGGIAADEAIITAATPMMRFDADPIPDSDFIDRLAKGHHRPGPFMSRRECTIGWGQREVSVIDLQVGATCPTHCDLDQHFARARPRHGAIDLANVLRTEEDRRPHRVRNRLLGRSGIECHCHNVLRI